MSSLCLSACLSLCFSLSLSLCFCLCLGLSPLCLCLSLSVSLSVCLSLSVSGCLCICLWLCVCVCVSLSLWPSCLSACLCLSLSLWYLQKTATDCWFKLMCLYFFAHTCLCPLGSLCLFLPPPPPPPQHTLCREAAIIMFCCKFCCLALVIFIGCNTFRQLFQLVIHHFYCVIVLSLKIQYICAEKMHMYTFDASWILRCLFSLFFLRV